MVPQSRGNPQHPQLSQIVASTAAGTGKCMSSAVKNLVWPSVPFEKAFNDSIQDTIHSFIQNSDMPCAISKPTTDDVTTARSMVLT